MINLASTVRSALLAAPEVGTTLKFYRDSILFHQKQEANGMFLIESGLVKLTRTSDNGSKLILSVSGANQLIGEECMGPPQSHYLADACSLTDVSGYRIPISVFKRLCEISEFATTLVSYLVARDRERVRKVELLSLNSVESRILHGLADVAKLVQPEGNRFPVPMTQMEVASFVGATRETTSATLSRLQERKLVVLGRRLITTVHPAELVMSSTGRRRR